MILTVGKLKEISEIMLDKPVNDALDRPVSKLEAVGILKREILGMLEKGYSLENISKILKENGFDIPPPTLKSYFNKVKDKPAKKQRAAKTAADPEKQIGSGS